MPRWAAYRWLWVLVVALGCGLALTSPSVRAASITISPSDAIQSFTVQGSGEVAVNVTDIGQGGICRENVYAFAVDDPSGAIGDLHPGDAGWPAAAQARSQLVHVWSDNGGATATLNLQAGTILGFSFQQPCIEGSAFVYSFVQANPPTLPWDGVFLNAFPVNTDAWELGWEDGGDSDYNDIVVDVSHVEGNTLSVTPAPPADTTPPTVSISADPTGIDGAGDNVVAGTEQLSAAASDDTGIAGVQFKLDGQNLGSEVTAAPYTINWDTTTAADGNHILTAIATDTSGNSTNSDPLAVTVLNDLSAGLGDGSEPNPIALPTAGCGAAASAGYQADINSIVPDTACAQAATCKGQNTRWGTMNGHAQWNQWPSGIAFWKYNASVRVCIDLKKRTVLAFDSNTQEATYVLHPFITYDNAARWSFGPLKLSTSFARVTDSFTTCPFFSFIHVGCFKKTFTITFHVYAATGQYQPEVAFN